MGKFRDLTGQRFGRLEVVGRADNSTDGKAMFRCLCSCGQTVVVRGASLLASGTRSCGCLSREGLDLVGKRFGRWLVVNPAPPGPHGRFRFNCRCDCGKLLIVSGSSLFTGKTSSCGCLAIEIARERYTHDLSGKKYGRWTVVSIAERKSRGSVSFNCVCSCGKAKIVTAQSLVSGGSTSCGCYKSESTRKRRLVDLTGKRFGRLTVIKCSDKKSSHGRVRWWCFCDCGLYCTVTGSCLTNGYTKSCGCLFKEFTDLFGKTFGRLTVVSRNVAETGVAWDCLCECGSVAVVRSGALIKGSTKSCGCYGRERTRARCRKKPYESLYQHIVRSARLRQLDCLSYDEFVKYTKIHHCTYCLGPVLWTQYNTARNGAAYNLDRINNNFGYVSSNLSVCCRRCNRMKRDMGIDQFYHMCAMVASVIERNDVDCQPVVGGSKTKALYHKLIEAANKRNLSYFSYNDFLTFVEINCCAYCGSSVRWDGQGYNLDRIDNKLNYTMDNVVVCCKYCNRAKTDMPQDEFINLCKTITKVRNDRQATEVAC